MAAAAADSFPGGGGPAAVKLPPSPPLKVLAEQLRRDAEGGPGAWRLSRAAAGRGPLELAAVWMQGAVVAAGGGEARLRDPSGAFSVRGLERVPRGRPCLAPGSPLPLPSAAVMVQNGVSKPQAATSFHMARELKTFFTFSSG
uniref:RecQ mediated genome instability 2 n=1 Tax=Equus caballus TaxID=9796 RepID=A0A9L0RA57_HORSE